MQHHPRTPSRSVFAALVLGALVMFGAVAAAQEQPCEQLCVFFCIILHSHPDEAARGECIRTCITTKCQVG